jgi:serine protease AprX
MDLTKNDSLGVKLKLDTPKKLGKFKFLLCCILCFILLLPQMLFSQKQNEERMAFEYPIESPKLDLKTRKFIEGLPSDSVVAVWVFFKDKGIKSTAEYQTALALCAGQLSPRALKRRMQRGQSPGLDFTDIPVRKQYLDELRNSGVKIRVVSKWLNAVSVLANKHQIEKIESLPFVRAFKKVVTFARKMPTFEKTQLEGFGKLYEGQILGYGQSEPQLAQIHVPELHNLGFSGKGVLITFLDTGFFIHHPVFKHILDSDRLIATHDFINGDEDVEDQDDAQRGHGTAVFSVVGGLINDTLVGCAYGAEFALAKTEIVSQEIKIEEDHWVAGIEWADSIGADVVSSSLGYNEWYTYKDMDGKTAECTIAADLAVSKGIVVVNAAGNERGPWPSWNFIIAPADGDSVIAVGAVDREGNIASFSSMGPTYDGRIKPDVDACGVQTFCASSGGGYTRLDGTSLSTPLVAGVCALLLEAHPGTNPIRVREALWTTASQADHPNNSMGYGIVNALKASGFGVAVSPHVVNFEASFGDTQSQQMILNLTDYWEGPGLKWKASTTADWIIIHPDSGITPSSCSVMVHPTNLKAGINQDSILISSQNAIESQQKVPVIFILHPTTQVRAFPNPFTDSLTVIVEKPNVASKIKVSVFTVAGELVDRLPEKSDFRSTGDGKEIYEQTWEGKNEKGEEVASGIYLLKIDIDDRSQIVKVAKIK